MPDVLVIGAGLAGLVAARDLEAGGRSVAVLEARERIGGRVWLQRDALRGLDLDMGGAWVADCQPHVWAECDRYGVAREHDPLPTHVHWVLGGERRTGILPLGMEDLGAFERAVAALLAAARRHDASRPPDAQGLEDLDVPVADWVDRLGLPPRVRGLLRLWCSACASARPADASMLEILRWLSAADHRLWPHLEAAVLGWRLPEGTAALYEAIAGRRARRRAARGAGRGGRAGARPGHRRHGRGGALRRPPPGGDRAGRRARGDRLHAALDAAKAAAAAENHAGQGVKAWVLARGVPDDLFALGGDTALDFAGAMAATPDGVLLVCFGPSAADLDVHDADAVAAAVRELAPEAEVVAVHAHDWAADPWSRGTWCVLRPGQVHRAWSALRAPEGRVHFAGAHTALRWPSFMDGAVESGRRVAAEVLAAPG